MSLAPRISKARASEHVQEGGQAFQLQDHEAPTERPALVGLLRVHLTYFWRHHRPCSISRPARFTEYVQGRKLTDRDPRIPLLIDKLQVKRSVAEILGPDWITPTLWSGTMLPRSCPLQTPFVVKSRHGCKQSRIVRSPDGDWNEVRRAARRWMSSSYGRWLDEWGYKSVPRGLLIEPLLGDGLTLPIDYKLFVFHGRVHAIQVHLDREGDHRWIVFDRDWRRLSTVSKDQDPRPPGSLGCMIAGAEALGRGFDFVRIDLYEVDDRPRFGEMTFYPGSGLERLDPPVLDQFFGELWRACPANIKRADRTIRVS